MNTSLIFVLIPESVSLFLYDRLMQKLLTAKGLLDRRMDKSSPHSLPWRQLIMTALDKTETKAVTVTIN